MKRVDIAISIAALAFTAALTQSAACSAPGAATAGGSDASTAAAGGLTRFQIEHGIGPITAPVTLGAVDQALAAEGLKVFEQKCSACHKMGERYVGPALADVTRRRSSAFIMNMALNPLGMIEKHPETKKLLAEYLIAMPNQNLTPEQARQVLEYLRTQVH